MRQFSGTTPAVSAVWDGTDTGNVPVAQGTYTLTLVSTDTGGNQSTPVTTTVFPSTPSAMARAVSTMVSVPCVMTI